MVDLIPLDYDALAEPTAAPPAAPEEDRATRATRPEPPPAADYVVPRAPALPTVKFADEQKPAEPKPKAELIPLDYDAFGEGSFVPEAAKAVAAGAVETTGGMLKGLGGQRQGVMADRAQRDARAKVLQDLGYTGTTVIGDLPPDKQAELRSKLQAANDDAIKNFDLTKDPFYQAGTATEKWSQDKFAAAHDYEDSWTRQLGQGFGSIAPYIAANFVPGVGQAVSLEAGYASSVGQQVDDAIKHGASKQQIIDAAKIGGAGGLTEQLPMEVIFDRVPLPAMGKVVGALAKITSTAFAEGGQEAVQQVWQNLTAKYIYNPKQDPLEGVAQAAAIGAIVGGTVGAPHAALGNHGEETPAKADDTPDVAAPVQPEGTPAAVTQQPEISTPGSLAATTPAPPAGTEKQPPSPIITTPAPAVGDPRTPAKPPLPAVTAPAAAGVEVVTPAAPASDLNAALTGAPVEQIDEQPGSFDLRETLPETATAGEVDIATREHEARIRDMFRDEHVAQKRQEQLADVTKVAPANTDIAAALAPAARVPPPRMPMPETLGTGQALAPTPVQPAAEPAITAQPAQPPAAAPAVGTPPVPPTPSVTTGGVSAQPVPTDVAAFTAALPQSTGALVSQEAAPPPVQATPPATVEAAALTPELPLPPVQATEAPGRAAAPEAPIVQPQPRQTLVERAFPEEGPPRAVLTRLSRDAAESARAAPEMQRSKASELPGFNQALDDVAAEVMARRRAESPGASVGQLIRDSEAEIIAKVKERLAPTEEAADVAREAGQREISAAAEAKEGKAARQEEKVKAQAAAETGQKKERAGKEKGKSATGIRGESEKATLAAYAREMAKPEAQRDQLLVAWGHVHQKQKILPKNPKPEKKAEVDRQRAEAMAQKQQIQEMRAAKAGEAAEARGGLSPERAATRDKVQSVLEQHPLPPLTGRAQQQQNALVDHLKAFRAAVKASGVKLADHIDRVHQSMQENLAIFARKVSTKPGAEVTPHDFAMAQLFLEAGADQDFYGLTTSEALQGSRYEEAIGEDLGVEASRVREDTSLESRVHGQALTTGLGAMFGEEEALVRSGRAATQERAASRQARDEAARQPPRDIAVTRPSDGARVTVSAETRKGSDVLREVNRGLQADRPRGFISTIQNALVKHLTALVGDIDVHYVSAADMMQLHTQRGTEPAGLYYNYSAAQRANGAKPQVFILDELTLHPAEHAHTVLHELTHAATSLALTLNSRGTAKIVGNMMRSLGTQLSPAERQQFQHAFTSPAEFVAEAFSNRHFQDLLGVIQMPAEIRRQIGGVSSTRTPSWWDGVVAMVSNSIGMLWGQRGQSYMEQVTRLFPEIATSQAGQRVLAREAMTPQPAEPTHPVGDIQALNLNFQEIAEGARSRLANFVTPRGRMLRDTLSTSGQLMRSSEALFGGENNPQERKIKAMLRREGLAQELRSEPVPGANSEDLELAQLELRDTDKAAYRDLSQVLRESSRYKLDPTVGLNHPNNAHISKTGVRHRQVRAMHAELTRQWNALPAKARAVGQQTIDHYRKTGEYETGLFIRHALETAAQKYGAKPYPAGKTIDDAIAWVKSGDAARDVVNQTPDDKAWHAALGKTAASLAKVPMLRKVKGIYVPFTRHGKYFISATERPFGTMAAQQNLPAGAVMDAENRLLFKNRADLDAFADTYPGQVAISIKWVDPLTGKATVKNASYVDPATGQLVGPRETWVATVQNKRVEMSDNASQLKARARELQAQGHHASAVGQSRQGLAKRIREIAPREIQTLIKNLEQTTIGQTTVGQEAVGNAVYDAYIRSMTSASHVQRGLKRRGVLGENEDLLLATRDYNRNFARHVSNVRTAPELAQASNDVDKYISAQQHIEPADSNLTARRQSMNAEVDNRIAGHPSDSSRSAGIRTLQAIKQIVYMAHLASPHFSIMNAAQPTMTTLPVLSAKYGAGTASRQLGLAYAIGAGRAVKSGAAETGRALKNIVGRARKAVDNDQFWHDQVAGEADAPQLQALFENIRHLGYGAASGIEAGGLAELDMNFVEKRINRLVNIAKALPEAIEGVNRYATAIAAYRSAVLSGMSHESAMRDATLTVEQTQGGYGAANNPTLFRNPLLQPALQFKKYALNYGNLYWRNVANMFSRDPATRKQAAKTVAGLSLATVAMAGLYGLPLVEPLRWLLFAANAAGLSDGDWDNKEIAMQKWLATMIQWATGSKGLGEALAEANMRGYTRLANIDASNSFGNDSLFLFGQPKSADAGDIEAWLFKAISGAPGGMFEKSYKALQHGDVMGAIPWPKIMSSAWEGYKLATKGTVDKTTGEQYAKPVGAYEAGVKVLGFQPASSARQWEGGSASQSRKLKETNADRRTLMARWRNASGSERQQIFRDEVRAWNAAHKNPDERIQMQDLMSSVRSKKASNKRLAKALQYEE